MNKKNRVSDISIVVFFVILGGVSCYLLGASLGTLLEFTINGRLK